MRNKRTFLFLGLVLGMALVTSTMVLVANLVTDVAYAFADPRIRYD